MIERRESPLAELLTIRDYIRWGATRFSAAGVFFGHGTDNAWDEASHLVLSTLHLPWDSSPDLLNARLTLEERKHVINLIERRISERIPAPYLTGEAWYAGMPFYVDERVLVPRSPIIELIEQQFQPWLANYPSRILDLCCGSGCIGIVCAAEFMDSEVVVSDISADALAVAQSNIERHHLTDQVHAVESDLFANLQGERFDLIVSNPPYVNEEDLAAMPAEFHAEPEIALGSGSDGLDFTRRLLAQARNHLTEQGLLIVEVGNSWPALEAAYPDVPFTWLEFERGGHGVFALTADQLP
ncbi:50S ribosomal protein L3 N(5)-glutamine methyltransferase [Maricurvus nonylphenolicus]|uniref:50S ribosomal protein L3 N(5)-glutamine methyltransferase n=1 Tax=Maricurvus nonylphenolicus TaxID=1008307 RepID=UPI0036F3D1B3